MYHVFECQKKQICETECDACNTGHSGHSANCITSAPKTKVKYFVALMKCPFEFVKLVLKDFF